MFLLKTIIKKIQKQSQPCMVHIEKNVFLNLASGKIVYDKDFIFHLKIWIDPAVNIFIGEGTGLNSPFTVRGCGALMIGKYAAIGKEVLVVTSNHLTNFPNMQVTLQNNLGLASVHGLPETVGIGNATWVGDRVTFLPGSSIGDGCIVGAGSIVTKQFPAFQVLAGNPARIIRPRFSENIIEQLLDIRWWDWSEEKMKRNELFFETDLLATDEISNLGSLIIE